MKPMQRTPTTQTEPLLPIVATANELVAVGAAITTYQRLLTRTPARAAEHRETIKLLERFQKRLTQLPMPAPQEAKDARL
jgi:hypothetical protein